MKAGIFTTKIFVFLFLLIWPYFAQTKEDTKSNIMLDNIRRMRLKQQQEEIVIRETKFVHVDKERHCTPVQQIRQRIRDIEASSGKKNFENININAGHEELNVADNHGTINSDININVINQGQERECP